MCDHGDTVEVASLLAFNGEWHRRTWLIDRCIAPIVEALNQGGIETIGSCCGHGAIPGEVLLRDGRYLVIVEERGLRPDDPWPTGGGE